MFETVANVSLGMFHDPLSCTNNYNLIHIGLQVVAVREGGVVGRGCRCRTESPQCRDFSESETDSTRFECRLSYPLYIHTHIYSIYIYVYNSVCVFDVTLCHIITDNLLKLQHTPGNYPGTGCVLLPNPRKLCTVIPPLP